MNIFRKISTLVKKLVVPFFYIKDKKYVLVKENGMLFLCRNETIDKPVVYEILRKNVYFRNDFDLKSGDNIVDIGGHIGCYSISMANEYYNVFTFEPEKDNFNLLQHNIRLNNLKNIKAFNIAISDKNGKGNLFVGKGHTAMHSLQDADSNVTQEVETWTVKKIIEKEKLDRINLLKIDAEGAEYSILLNMDKKTLNKIDRIILEYHDYLNVGKSEDIVDFLRKNGFYIRIEGSEIQKKYLKEGVIIAFRK